MRILYIIPTLDRSGSEKQLTLLATGLPRDEFEVEVCALTRGGPYRAVLEADGIPVSVLGKRLKIDPLAAWKLARLLRNGKYDVVHTWLFAANSYGRALARRHTPVLIASERCADHWKGSLEQFVDRRLAPKTDCIVVNSKAVHDYYCQRGIDSSRLVMIPNGIDLSETISEDPKQVREELGLPPDKQVLGFVGRLWPQKRVKDLVWASEIIHRSKDTYTLIVGDGPLRGELENYSKKIGMQERIRFVGLREDTSRMYAAMDLFILPSAYEGMPNVLLEAMRAGLPIVASDIPGTNELVRPGENGLLVPLGNIRELTRTVDKLLGDPELMRRLGDAGRALVRTKFGADRMIERHAQLYRERAQRKGIQ